VESAQQAGFAGRKALFEAVDRLNERQQQPESWRTFRAVKAAYPDHEPKGHEKAAVDGLLAGAVDRINARGGCGRQG